MTKRASGLSKFLAASAMTLSLGGLAIAGPPRPEFRVDGSVKVAGQVFASAAEWARSDLFRTSGARCGSEDTLPHQELISPTDCSFDHTTINPEYNDNRTLVIQVVFHIIKQNATVGDIPPALLESQIDILNEDYLAIAGTPGAPGANTKIEFVLAKFDPTGAPTPGYEVISNHPEWFQDPDTSPSPMKVALNWDPARYLNVYTNDAAGYLGYATFPFDEAGTVDDGIVVLWNSVGRNAPYGPPYDQGRTLTHEVGHYLGLMHTFQQDPGDTCGTGYDAGDRVADTNTESGQTFGCPIGATSCGVAKPIENYMDYTDDTCMSKFSVEQANRIRCSLINYRTINTKPSADFTFSDDLLAVTFTNTSTDAETALAQLHHAWDFGDGQTSTEASPVHTYATAGTYTVTLTVVDSGSGDSTAMNSVMVVDMPRPPDADPSQPDSDPGNPGDDDGNGGGGCCQTQGGDVSYVLCGIPVLLVLRRRRRQ